MAYTSKGYERKWTYEHSDNDFDARVGKILSGGLDLKSSLRAKALGELATNQELEAAAAARKPASAATLNARGPDTRRPTGRVDTKGYVWVDPKGNSLGPIGGPGAVDDVHGTTGTAAGTTGSGRTTAGVDALTLRGPKLTEKQAAAMAMDPTERSVHLWRRLNPGAIEQTTRLPRSTFKAHFGPKADAEDADKVDKTYHFQKTDFSEYTEVKLKLMNHLKSG